MSYESVESVARAADLIVVGTVVSVEGVEEDRQTAGKVEATVLFTDFRVRVDELLKGSAGTPEIVVHQTGGRTPSTLMEIDDDPLLEVGATYMLFLRVGPTGRYRVAGGPDGRLVLEAGRAYSLSTRASGRDIDDLAVDGLPMSDLRDQVALALR